MAEQQPGDAGSTFSTLDGAARLALVGDVGEATATRMRGEVLSGLQEPLRSLTVDLTRCDYLDPAGVELLGAAFGRAADLGSAIRVTGASPNVRIILGIAGLLDLAESSGHGGPSP